MTWFNFSKFMLVGVQFDRETTFLKDLSQFQRKSAHAPQKELPKRKLQWKFMKVTEMIISVFIYIK